MKQQMFDIKTGEACGEFEIPDEIIREAMEVRDWIENNNVHELYGLTLCPATRHRIAIK